MTEEQSQKKPDVTKRRKWDGCGCDRCLVAGRHLRQADAALREALQGLINCNQSEHVGPLIVDTFKSFIRILDQLEKGTIDGLIFAKSMAQMLQSYIDCQVNGIQMEAITRTKVEEVLTKMMVPIGSVKVEPGARPPWMPDPEKMGNDDEGSSGGGGPGGYGFH